MLPLSPPVTIGNRYQIQGRLGRGGMAVVYLAYDPKTDRQVALKMMLEETAPRPQQYERFKREVRIIAHLEHFAIVPVYDIDEHDNQPYLVMRYMNGGSLKDRLNHGRLPIASILPIIQRIADALDKVHAQQIIHRDIKPANILFDQDGYAYLSDFGIARSEDQTENLTGDRVMGTAAYLSPEQACGEMIDGRTDLYALGVVVFEMLCGQQPYDAPTATALALQHISSPIPNLLAIEPGLPAGVSSFIQRAMAKKRAERFATGSEFAQVLKQALENTTRGSYETMPVTGEQPVVHTPPPAAPSGPAQPASYVVTCMKCGKKLPAQAKECPECGSNRLSIRPARENE